MVTFFLLVNGEQWLDEQSFHTNTTQPFTDALGRELAPVITADVIRHTSVDEQVTRAARARPRLSAGAAPQHFSRPAAEIRDLSLQPSAWRRSHDGRWIGRKQRLLSDIPADRGQRDQPIGL